MALKTIVSDALWWHTLTRHKSRLFFPQARRYTSYLQHCRRVAPVTPDLPDVLRTAVEQFERDGYATFRTPETAALAEALTAKIRQEEAAGIAVWDGEDRYVLDDPFRRFEEPAALFAGPLGLFLNGLYRTHYKLHSGTIYRSQRRRDAPEGSQLWHGDGGPGTCVNIMFTLSETTAQNGAMKCLPWPYSLQVFSGERPVIRARMAEALRSNPALDRLGQRKVKCDFYAEQIAARFADRVVQPTGAPGIVYLFRNNLLHAGGFCEPGQERLVYGFHAYPSDRPAPLERYRADGLPKTASYPKDPAA